MKRLVAVSEWLAVYERSDARPEIPVDPFRYLKDLLRIRSASGLVSFLQTHPHELSSPTRGGFLDFLREHAEPPAGALRFSSTAMMNAADKHRVEYFDSLVELDGPGDGREDRYHFVEIASLERLVERIEALLLMADTCYGGDACREMFGFTRGGDEVKVTVGTHDAMRTFPRDESTADLGFYLMGPPSTSTASIVTIRPDDVEIVFESSDSEEDAVSEAAGIMVSMALTRWLKYFTRGIRVVCPEKGRFELRESETRDVGLELARIVIDHDFGICPRFDCGRPYIARKRNAEGTLVQGHCSDSCKVKASREG